MSTLSPTKKVSRRQELRQDTVVTFYARALDLIENHRQTVYQVLGGLVFLVVAVLGWNWYQSNQNDKALSEMAEAVRLYEAGSWTAALDGDASFSGLIDIADRFGGTTSGNLARFYTADALFRTGEMDRALEYFQDYDKGADYIGASAFAGEAAIYELRGEHERAGDLYLRAANVFRSDITSPMYLSNAARAYAASGKVNDAADALEAIRDDFPDSQAARNIDYRLAALGKAG